MPHDEPSRDRPSPGAQSLTEKYFIQLISPTWAFADAKKRATQDKQKYTLFIREANKNYFLISAVALIIYIGASENVLSFQNSWKVIVWHIIWSIFLLSRCNEIFYAFAKDARDKVSGSKQNSNLDEKDRIILALRSYLELIINFAILYSFLPMNCWMEPTYAPKSITNLVYYSATTITTSGNGAMIPVRFYAQFLSTYEIYAGLLLLVVCFALYAGPIGKKTNKDV